MIKTRKLKNGDLIAIAAPASPFERGAFMAGVKRLRDVGYRVTFRKDIFAKDRYLAGSDIRRAEELNQFFADPDIKAIFFARGGYGSQRILHLLNIEAIKANPKIIIGYSDLTALFGWLYRHDVGGIFYGPTVAKHFKLARRETMDLMMKALTDNTAHMLSSNGAKVLKHGEAEGTLIGGCLSLVTSSIGTAYDLPTEGSILFLEDVNEPIYKYDRMLTHLKASGKLRAVSGIVFGSLGLAKGENKNWMNKTLSSVLADFPGPIVTNFPSGHFDFGKLFVTLPLGVRVRLLTKPITLEMLESALV